MNKRILIFPLALALTLGGFLLASRLADTGSMPANKAGATALALALVCGGAILLALLLGREQKREDDRDIARGGEIAEHARARRDADADAIDGWKIIIAGGIIGGAIALALASHAGR